jgi:hypothetical protein
MFAIPVAGPAITAENAKKRRAGPKQESKVIPVATSRNIIQRELLPPAKQVDEKDDPGRKAIPKSPKQILPPHDIAPYL